jgi:hypothetical protein
MMGDALAQGAIILIIEKRSKNTGFFYISKEKQLAYFNQTVQIILG